MKTDKSLGSKVERFLNEKRVNTPKKKNNIGNAKKKKLISAKFAEIMEVLELDLKNDSLQGTPDRVAKMFIDEMFYGLNYDNFPKCTAVKNTMKYDEMVVVDRISMSSACEHHFVVIDGFASVAYIPKNKVIGLSKINRIVDFFAKRPQIQERLTEQIYYALNYILETEDIAVKIKAVHYCVKARGVKDVTSSTTTTKIGGVFKESEARNEFLNLIKR